MVETVCRTLRPGPAARFEILVGAQEQDRISCQIRNGNYLFPDAFDLLFSWLRPGDRVLDLGAHVGTFALAAAALGCRVVAVEASPANAALLRASAARNGFAQLAVVDAAVNDRPGSLAFLPGGPYGTVAPPRFSGSTIEVPAVTVDGLLDGLGWQGVDLIKMDVEGSEVAAVQGMSHLLSREDAPAIFYESNGYTLARFGQTPNHLFRRLMGLGYAVYWLEGERLVPVDVDQVQVDCNMDCLAVKQPFSTPPGWRVEEGRSWQQTISRVVAACAHDDAAHRAYTARCLAKADERLLAHGRVRRALNRLQIDPDPKVRAAASWWTATKPALLTRAERLVQATLGLAWTNIRQAMAEKSGTPAQFDSVSARGRDGR